MESTQLVLKMLQDERSKCNRLEAMLNEETFFREMADKKLGDYEEYPDYDRVNAYDKVVSIL